MNKITLICVYVLVALGLAACSVVRAPAAPPVVTIVSFQTPVSPVPAPPSPTPVPQPPTATAAPVAATVAVTPVKTVAVGSVVPPAAGPRRISFQTGQWSATVQGTLATNGRDAWILRILGGQTLNVSLATTNGRAKITIVGADGYPLITDHADATQWSGTVPATQDYTVQVLAYDNTAPAYTLQVSVPPVAQPTQAAPVAKRISFAPNSIAAVVTGNLSAGGSNLWILKVMAGQTMSVNLVPTGGSARLTIYGVDGTVLISDHADATQWSGPIPSTQDYNVLVTALGNTAPSYRLEVTIPPR